MDVCIFRFDLDHLRAIHRHLFQDVYAWAGKIRTVEISKSGHPKGVARPAGFEPATCGLEVRCSIQLSYGRRAFNTYD